MASHNRSQSAYQGKFSLDGTSNPPVPHHHHQLSFEGIIDFNPLQPLTAAERNRALVAFREILKNVKDKSGVHPNYNRHLLVYHTYEYSRSDLSKDAFLRVFFSMLGLDIASDEAIDTDDDDITQKFIGFADMLIDQFYLPLKACGNKTPQPTPTQLSALERVRSSHNLTLGTEDRLSSMRALTLQRDKHRCVMSKAFCLSEASRRAEANGTDAKDDDGKLLTGGKFDSIEVAHILPHALTKLQDGKSELDESRKLTLAILNMFDVDVVREIEGYSIDSPRNGISLVPSLHVHFGQFKIYFEEVPGQKHVYNIETYMTPWLLNQYGIPARNRNLARGGEGDIDPPSPRLLALHRAIACILHLSGAGGYIDKILRNLEDNAVREDGSTELGRLVNLRYHRWIDGATVY